MFYAVFDWIRSILDKDQLLHSFEILIIFNSLFSFLSYTHFRSQNSMKLHYYFYSSHYYFLEILSISRYVKQFDIILLNDLTVRHSAHCSKLYVFLFYFNTSIYNKYRYLFEFLNKCSWIAFHWILTLYRWIDLEKL